MDKLSFLKNVMSAVIGIGCAVVISIEIYYKGYNDGITMHPMYLFTFGAFSGIVLFGWKFFSFVRYMDVDSKRIYVAIASFQATFAGLTICFGDQIDMCIFLFGVLLGSVVTQFGFRAVTEKLGRIYPQG